MSSFHNIYLDDFGPEKELIKVDQLPGGEFHPKISSMKMALMDQICINTRLKNGNDVLKLLTVTNALREYGKNKLYAHIPYIPGGRQDRVPNLGEAFTLKVYADLINSQNYLKVFTADPHSDVTTALINNCQPVNISFIISRFIHQYDVIIVPDAGASKKTSSYLGDINWNGEIVQCLKVRDTKTGKLSDFRVLDGEKLTNKKAIILDDICDGGGTFIGLANKIKDFNPKQLSLYVTHGIFSNGLNLLHESFNSIITTDSWMSKNQYNQLFGIDKFLIMGLNG